MKRTLRGVEFVVLFFILPLAVFQGWVPFRPIPLALAFALLCLAILLIDPQFDRTRLYRLHRTRGELRRITFTFLIGAVLLAVMLWIIKPDNFFILPRQRTALWAVIMVGYPLFSVYPQELIYRAFLFHRYRMIFPKPWMMIAASAVAFGYVHYPFGHFFVVILSTIGGAMFAWSYHRSGSIWAPWLEHAWYGQLIFTIGLGEFFYHGTPRI